MKLISFFASFFIVTVIVFFSLTNRTPFITYQNIFLILALITAGIVIRFSAKDTKYKNLAFGMIWGSLASLLLCFIFFIIAIQGLAMF